MGEVSEEGGAEFLPAETVAEPCIDSSAGVGIGGGGDAEDVHGGDAAAELGGDGTFERRQGGKGGDGRRATYQDRGVSPTVPVWFGIRVKVSHGSRLLRRFRRVGAR